MHKWVYTFGDGKAEGASEMKNLLGGKGANLAEMANLGLPVPPGFTITTEVCTHFYANDHKYPAELAAQLDAALAHVGALTARGFGDDANPLLVSVRSGARASMPGMMDTVLNLGLNDVTVGALARGSGDERFAWDSLPPLHPDVFERGARHRQPQFRGHSRALQGAQGLRARHRSRRARLARDRDALQGAGAGRDRQAVPAGPARAALGRHRRGVLLLDEPARHHLSPPARHSRKLGHGGQRAGHGVRQYGRDLGDRRRLHPQSLDRREGALRRIPGQRPGRGRGRRHPHAAEHHRGRAHRGRLRQAVDGRGDAEAFRRIRRGVYERLEKHYRDMQDMEFTVERGKLWMLQTRNGKRTAKAALRSPSRWPTKA
jgi:pyruvate,orthophosphate dikinase